MWPPAAPTRSSPSTLAFRCARPRPIAPTSSKNLASATPCSWRAGCASTGARERRRCCGIPTRPRFALALPVRPPPPLRPIPPVLVRALSVRPPRAAGAGLARVARSGNAQARQKAGLSCRSRAAGIAARRVQPLPAALKGTAVRRPWPARRSGPGRAGGSGCSSGWASGRRWSARAAHCWRRRRFGAHVALAVQQDHARRAFVGGVPAALLDHRRALLGVAFQVGDAAAPAAVRRQRQRHALRRALHGGREAGQRTHVGLRLRHEAVRGGAGRGCRQGRRGRTPEAATPGAAPLSRRGLGWPSSVVWPLARPGPAGSRSCGGVGERDLHLRLMCLAGGGIVARGHHGSLSGGVCLRFYALMRRFDTNQSPLRRAASLYAQITTRPQA